MAMLHSEVPMECLYTNSMQMVPFLSCDPCSPQLDSGRVSPGRLRGLLRLLLRRDGRLLGLRRLGLRCLRRNLPPVQLSAPDPQQVTMSNNLQMLETPGAGFTHRRPSKNARAWLRSSSRKLANLLATRGRRHSRIKRST